MRFHPWLWTLTGLLAAALWLAGCPEELGDDDDASDDDVADDDSGDDDTGGDDDASDDDTGDDDSGGTDEDGDGWTVEDGDCDDADPDVHPEAPDVCDDVPDNDCDGNVDPSEDDVDGDGLSECEGDCDDGDDQIHPYGDEEWFDGVDSDCDGFEDPDPCDDPPPATAVTPDPACTYTPTVGSFNPTSEWSMTTYVDYPSYDDSYTTPMVGHFTDDNGDSYIDSLDIPDIAITTCIATGGNMDGVIRLISGDGSAIHWSVNDALYQKVTYYPYRYTGLALGDIDLDGVPEIVATLRSGSYCYVGAYDELGALQWVHTDHTVGCRNNYAALHDLEGDGDVEVVVGRLILEGADGSLQGEGAGGLGYHSGYSNSGYHSFGLDLDGDGTMEVVAGSSVYGPQGVELCATGQADGYPAAADLDGDGLGEFVVSGNGSLRTFEHDCTPIHSWTNGGGGYGGPPTIADFDGDGTLEIAVAGSTSYVVYEQDGAVLWSMPVTDASSNSTGSSVFDFDGDGAAEVVYADEIRLWVFDGATGAVLLDDQNHGSGTINEYPTIVDVDVDGDGKAEIVVVNSHHATGLYVVGDASDEWVSARQVWNQQAYYITNVDDDLGIPSPGPANWPIHNNFRQGAPGSFSAQAAANLSPWTYDPCQPACGDDVDVLVQVANDGLIQASADLVLAIYGEDGLGDRTLLTSTTLGAPLLSGGVSAAYPFTFPAADLAGYVALIAVVDDDQASNECDEYDNEAVVDLSSICQ